MKALRFAFLAGLLVVSVSMLAAPPSFKGEVFAGSAVMPNHAAVNIYWVFDDGIFREYVYYHATDEVRALASARYFTCQAADGSTVHRIALMQPGMVRAVRKGEEVETMALVKDGSSLVLPDGERLTRVVDPGQFIPLLQKSPTPSSRSGRGMKETINYAGCCDHCFFVHEMLGIESLNYLCCDYSCWGGGGFGGGGASGGW